MVRRLALVGGARIAFGGSGRVALTIAKKRREANMVRFRVMWFAMCVVGWLWSGVRASPLAGSGRWLFRPAVNCHNFSSCFCL